MTEKIQQKLIEEEMKESYVDYAMSVIMARALPDVRDGLKPVHRRILYAMSGLGLLHNKPHKKCARIVGNVLGQYHPHGDQSVYDALVRMAQNFSLRYPLINGHGNFGSIDGDPAAAYRYCIVGSALLLTNKGILPIKKVSNKKESKVDFKILSYNGKRNKASKFFNSGKHKTIKILTKSGYSLEGSYNHPILVWEVGPNFKPIISWKLLENLKENDIMIINRNNSLFSKKSLNLKKYFPKKGFKNDIKLPSKMNNNLAFLLGALVSEGSFHNKQILFNNKDVKFYNKIKSIILSQFEGIQLYERQIKGNCKELSIYEQKVVMFLCNIGLGTFKSNEKEVPFSVLMSTKENIKQFLISLFEGDGCVLLVTDKRHGGKSIQLTYDSKSENLIKQLKTLLLNFGVVSNRPYKDKRNGCLKLSISSYDNIYRFYKELGFFSKRKKDVLKSIKKINPTRLSKTDFIPFLNDYLRIKYPSQFIIKNNFDRYNSLIKNYSSLIRIIDNKDKSIIDWILKNKFYFDQLVKVEKSKNLNEVFSVKVDSKDHSFIANGFINHNTEARLSRISEELLIDLDKETVNFIPNFDNSLKEPSVLPAKLPNLLINGSSGIAVGMTTNIPPHNIHEVILAIQAMINNPDITVEELMKFIKGPDFPTGAYICGTSGVKKAYKTGRGKIIVRAKTKIEDNKIIITEIPYQINKSRLIESIANLVKHKTIEGISDIRDESDREGMRIVLKLKKLNPDLVLNKLYKHTQLQETYGIIMIALVNNEPKVLNLKQIIENFIEHRKLVITRRTRFELNKAEQRAHILEGLKKALENPDLAVKLIKSAENVEKARNSLIKKFSLTEIQANAILDMKLQKFVTLETKKLQDEHTSLLKSIENYKSILDSSKKILKLIKNELEGLKKYSDERRTKIIEEAEEIEKEDLIKEENVVITITSSGYIKQTPLFLYRRQKRGGKGVTAMNVKEEDVIEDLFITSNLNYLLFFTNKGKVYWLKAYQIPQSSRYSKGKAIVNLLRLKKEEKVTAILPIKQFTKNEYLLFATKKGIVKKTPLIEYSNPRKGGIIAINLRKDDEVLQVKLTPGNLNFILATKNGQAVKFNEKDVRAMSRTASGVIGIKLVNDEVVGMEVALDDASLLTATEKGYGKRTLISEYRLIKRGGKGVTNIKITNKNGKVVSVKTVLDKDELMFITQKGHVIRIPASNISIIGRVTQGVRIMKLKESDKLVKVARIIKN